MRWIIEQVNPEIIIPVHTTKHDWFLENFEGVRVLGDGKSEEVRPMEGEKRKIQGIVSGEYFMGEDWIRAGRRKFLLLNVIYYLQHFAGKEDGVSLSDILEFLDELRNTDREIHSDIIKPQKPVEFTLNELIKEEFIIETLNKKFFVNVEKVKSEKDLIYWRNVKGVFEKANADLSPKHGEKNE